MALSQDATNRLGIALASNVAGAEVVAAINNGAVNASPTFAAATVTGALTCGNFAASGANITLGSQASPAATGTTNANGTVLTAANNFVTGADGTKGVVLPATPTVGQEVTVVNTNGASALKVYADASGTGGTVNGGAANAAASLAANKGATYICISVTGANQWYSTGN